jgi:hypothetical protein
VEGAQREEVELVRVCLVPLFFLGEIKISVLGSQQKYIGRVGRTVSPPLESTQLNHSETPSHSSISLQNCV